MDLYENCTLCPRKCGADRTKGQLGFCKATDKIRIACATLHHGEEPPITGKGGSGTIFFTGCTLQCKFCQNHQISRGGIGKDISTDEFADICLNLQASGAENINLVTGTMYIPSIAEGLKIAKSKGLSIPILWNSSGFENTDTVELLNSFVDVYLPDIKSLNHNFSATFFNALHYPEAAKAAVEKMADSKKIVFRDNKIVSGTIVRHLVIPGYIDMSERVIRWFAETLKDKAIISIMFQYSPKAAKGEGFPARILDKTEMDMIYALLDEYGIEDGFIQEEEITDEWNPDFNLPDPFPGSTGKTIWHWKN